MPGESEGGEGIVVSHNLVVPYAELRFRYSRSGGPGGQHVNRTETRVELLFDVTHSPSLSEGQRARLQERLASKLDLDGVLHIVSSATRSQLDNRADAVARFQALLRSALRPGKRRLPTAPTAASRERRMEGKRRRSEIKTQRRMTDEG